MNVFNGAVMTLLILGDPGTGASNMPRTDEIAFVSQCRYSSGVKIILAYHFGSKGYRLIIRHDDKRNDVSTLLPKRDGTIDIDTNGGVGKIEGVSRLFRWLIRQPFAAVTAGAFPGEMRRLNVRACPTPYPFSP
jgi:hypothetical protein